MTDHQQPALTVLVLSGGSLAGKALGPASLNWCHPMLLPAGSTLAIHEIMRFYDAGPLPAVIRVVVDSPLPQDVQIRGVTVENLLMVSPQSGILFTLQAALPLVDTPWVLINPITTLPSRPAELCCEIHVGDHPLVQEEWSALRPVDGGVWCFDSKLDVQGFPTSSESSGEPSTFELSVPFTGILCAPTEFVAALLAELPPDCGCDLLWLAQRLYQEVGARVVSTPWHDLGHRTTHAASRRSRLPSRAFNRLVYCPRRDVIVKHSTDAARLQSERAYLQGLPPMLRRHFPALLPGDPGEESAVVMEAVPFPSLSELFLHWDLGPNAWLAILERLASVQRDFVNSSSVRMGSSAWLYSQKLSNRWDLFTQLEKSVPSGVASAAHGPRWWNRDLCVNGIWFPPLSDQVFRLCSALSPLETDSRLHLIHGDFCFNNILCDPLYCAIRLIDPRGESGSVAEASNAGSSGVDLPAGFGDSRYDLVKLYHSVAGHYDAVVNNLFRLVCCGDRIDVEFYSPPCQPFVERAFRRILQPACLSQQELLLLTSSLFFSMLPLHRDDSYRQMALAISGMLMFNAASH